MRSSILLLLLALLMACSSPPEGETSLPVKKVKANRIVLIFEEPVENGFFKNPETGKRGFGRTAQGDEIQIIDDHYIEKRLSFKIGADSDTVVIDTQREIMEVRLMYKGIDDLTYLFQNGDSVLFTYEGIKPIARILNREEETAITNYSLMVRDSLVEQDFTAMTRLRNPVLKMSQQAESDLPFQEFFQKVELEAAKDLWKEYEQEFSYLETALAKGTLSAVQYNFRLQSILNETQASQLLIRTYGKGENNPVFLELNEVVELLKSRYPNLNHDRKDSLLYTAAYRKYLGASVSAHTKGKIEMLSKEGRGAGARVPNQLQRYDSIRVIDFMSPLEKKITQYQVINFMLSQSGFFSIKDRLKYLNRFKNDFEDSVMVQNLISKYNIEFKIEDDIMLEAATGEKLSMQELVAAHSGKVIYVDYWASWCGPCIKEMPHSKVLQAELTESPIVYVYISSDRTARPWKKAMEKHDLNEGLHYRITNASTSQGLEDLQIMFIPRYMIYDRTGKLVDKDTYRPSESDALKAELTKYL